MSRTVIKLDLDTGDFVSSAGRAQQSVSGLIDKAKELRKEGKITEALHLENEEIRLKGGASALGRDIKALASDPRFQTTLPNGGIGFKVDSEYASLVKSQREAFEKITGEYREATRIGDVGKIRELTPLLERQQSEIHKTINDIIKTNGDFSKSRLPEYHNPSDQKKPFEFHETVKDTNTDSEFPKELPADHNPSDQKKPRIPSLPENKDWRELKGLSGAITQEHQARNWEQVAKLGTAKDTLRGIMGEYDRDGKMEAKLKADPELASQLKEIRDALKGTIAAINEAADNREYEKVDQLTGQAKQLQGISHKTVQEAAASPDSKTAQRAALASFLNVQTAQQMISAVTSGINTYVAHLDRSGIVNAMGSGDVMGAQIEELHRSAAEQSSLWGSIGRIGGGILGGIVGTFIGGPGLGTAGGAAIGSTLLGAGGDLVGTLGDEKKANEMATDEAYAKLWEQQAPAAMELTGLLGNYGGTAEENSRTMRHTWENAANTATEYGFSPEEGVEQVKQVAQQGLNERQALDAARDVFAFERGTGADRGVLAEFRNRTERFGIADGLNTAWQGNQASGMAPGQFNEFLRSMQKTFEDGISKGFVRGADEIAGNLSFLSGLNGDSELWKGELGANRLATMNSGLEATTALSSTSDILSFRGAQNLLKQWDDKGDAEERWKAIGDLDPKKDGLELRRGYDYVDAMAILERGLTPELFHTQMQMIEGVEGKGNRTGAVEQMKNIYGLNYTGSAALYQTYQDKLKTFNGDSAAADKYFSGDEWAKKLEDFKANPDNNDSTERTMLDNVADIKKYTYEIGQWHLDRKMPEIVDALKNAWDEASGKGVTRDTGAGRHLNPFPEEQPAAPSNETPAALAEPDYKTKKGANSDESVQFAQAAHEAGDPEMAWEHAQRSKGQSFQEEQEALRRLAQLFDQADWVKNNLFKSSIGGGKTDSFFTGNFNGKTDTADEFAKERFLAYSDSSAGGAANDAFAQAIAILQQFSKEDRMRANESNAINDAMPDVMSDTTGIQLIQAIKDLADKMGVTIEYL
jgi:hypothetical protein